MNDNKQIIINLINSSKLKEALYVIDKELSANPNCWITLFNKAYILIRLNRSQEAIPLYHNLAKIGTTNPEHYHALGDAFFCVSCYREAISVYQINLKKHPDFWQSRWCLSMTQLLLGDLSEGFKNHEYRLHLEPEEKKSQKPRWLGENIQEKTLLIRSEQGFGDTLQFMRYIPRLSHCKIILELPPGLLDLFKHLKCQLTCCLWPTPEHDFHVSLMSLPAIFKTDLSTIPPPITIEGARLNPVKNQIGIAWKGFSQHKRDWQRSLNVKLLAPLLQIPGINFVCLQKDLTQEEIEFLNEHHIERPKLENWIDTVRALETCERLICVDTAIAHLSGSMGIPTWIFTHYTPDWRWLLSRDDSPWYSSVRLFRQTVMDSWKEPIEKMRECFSRVG